MAIGAALCPAVAPAAQNTDVAQRLQQIVAGWRGAERGQPLSALHLECQDAAGPGGRYLLPDQLLLVRNLDAGTLRAALSHARRGGRNADLRFRVPPAGRFDAALVPIGPAGEPRDRWLLAVQEDLPLQDQVALYGHVLGHLLLNRKLEQMGQRPVLDPRDGFAHADVTAELRQVESTRNPLDRRVLDAYPLLTELLRTPAVRSAAYEIAVPGLRERLAEAGWPRRLVTAPYLFTEGRVYVSGSSARRGTKLRADALLRYEASLPIALVQTVRPGEMSDAAERRLVEYAHERMCLPFAYLLEENGAVHEFDWTAGNDPARLKPSALPAREVLWDRWTTALGLTDERAREALRYPYQLSSGQIPRYYQEAAITRAIIAVLQARRGSRRPRILLTMATGTGKTPVAFQIVWKLRRTHAIGNVLFLTDRDFLVGQAMDNAFSPFGDARDRIRGEARTSRDILFATYQALAGDEGRSGLYLNYPRDFFSLIIVDECHRGSAQDDSNWRSILDYFDSAVQLGLTATPLRTDNIQSYDYFGTPLATYSLRRGITDGFLAPYRVRRVWIGTAPEAEGSDCEAPEAAMADAAGNDAPRSDPPEWGGADTAETAVTMVARTEIIAGHVAQYLRDSDPMAKTIVFCVDQAHADQMRDALKRACGELAEKYSDYVERIVSDEGTDGKRALGRFTTPDEPAPVIVTTSKLLSTGVDVPTCKNIVLARPIGSMVEFKQIIGRGTRLHEPAKTWFTILDYAGATRHFFDAEFDGDPELVEIEVLAPQPVTEQAVPPTEESAAAASSAGEPDAAQTLSLSDGILEGGPENIAEMPGADVRPDSVTYPDAPSMIARSTFKEEIGLSYAAGLDPGSDGNGSSATLPSDRDPAAETPAPHAATGEDDATSGGEEPRISPKRSGKPAPQGCSDLGSGSTSTPATVRELKRQRDGQTIRVIGEVIYELGPDGRTLRTLSYRDYAKEALEGLCATPSEMRARWLREEQRAEIRGQLEDAGIEPHELAAALGLTDADLLDVLLHVAFGQPAFTRRERADRVQQERADFFAQHSPAAREILSVVLEKYVAGEAPDLSSPELLKVPPLSQRGTFMELAEPFGGGAGVRAALKELQALLYST